MNRLFVNIKVDREERPDLDRIYQLAHQLMTGRGGGWPLTVFLDPVERVPFFAGTYFPRERRYGMPAFREILESVDRWYRDNPGEVREQNGRVSEALRAVHRPGGGLPAAGREQDILQAAANEALARFDRTNGGFGGAPKFPQAPLLGAVARLADVDDSGQLETALKFSLERIAASGLRDHLDGGFFRYCVDEHWSIPHFEKMLYDNAMLLPLYAEGAERWNSPGLERVARGIAGWLDSVMAQDPGGYAASIDADADGEEGGFHVWDSEQIATLLPQPELNLFRRRYGLDGPPNFEGRRWHLREQKPVSELAREQDLSDHEVEEALARARARLLEARAARVHPMLDDKRLASWNALLAEGWVRAGRALQSDAWLDRADAVFGFIHDQLWVEGRLLAVYNRGQARLAAYLDDHAWLLNALTLYLQSRWERRWLDFAIRLADRMLEGFEDAAGGFFFSAAGTDVPITRSIVFTDDATPAGNAAAISGLKRLGHLVGDPRYTTAAERCLQRALPLAAESPLAHASMLPLLIDVLRPGAQVVLAGQSEAALREFRVRVLRNASIDCYLIGAPDDTLPGILADFRTTEPATAWLCRGLQCLPPAHTLEELERRLEEPDGDG
jgi:uncharacterized protein YyaL (SSP411 family)